MATLPGCLMLVNGEKLLRSAYYTSSDEDYYNKVGALRGFIHHIGSLLTERHGGQCTEKILVTFNEGIPQRKQIDPNYRDTSEGYTEDFTDQLVLCKIWLQLVGIQYISRDGAEGDDLMYSMVRNIKSYNVFNTRNGGANYPILVNTNNNSLFEVCLFNNVKLLYPKYPRSGMDSFLYDLNDINGLFGVESFTKLKDYLALIGNTGLNIPGIKGIGPKNAQVLLRNYACVADAYADGGNRLSPSMKVRFINGMPNFTRSEMLLENIYWENLGLSLECIQRRPVDAAKVNEFLVACKLADETI